jgi:uncharacterized membrane protein
MESKAKFLGHPIHQILIVIPLGLFVTGTIIDVISSVWRHGKFAYSAFVMIGGGIVGGIAAAVFGLIDFLAIPVNTAAKVVGLLHAVGNVFLLALFGASWLARKDHPEKPGTKARILSLLGVAMGGATGWLGGELVDRYGIGVSRGANLNAPSTLSGRPAYESVSSPWIPTEDPATERTRNF